MSSVKPSHFLLPSLLFVPPRMDSDELLDLGVGADEDVQANFNDLRRINHCLGGISALTQHIYPRLLALAGSTTLVDVGTGSGDIGAVMTRWAKQHNIDLNVWGIDISARNLRLTQNTSVAARETRVQADAMQLPFKNGSVDYFISSLFLHHLTPEMLQKLLASTFQAAKKGIIMSDLTRGRLPQIAFKLGQPIFARNFLTQHDGMASIRRAYTPDELLHLAQAAGFTNARVYRHFGWRMTLVCDK